MKQTISPFLRLQIIKEAILADMVLTDYTKIINLDNWKQYMQQLIEDTPLSELMQIENAAKKLKNTAPPYGFWMEKYLLEKKLMRTHLAGHELLSALSDYAECILSYPIIKDYIGKSYFKKASGTFFLTTVNLRSLHRMH